MTKSGWINEDNKMRKEKCGCGRNSDDKWKNGDNKMRTDGDDKMRKESCSADDKMRMKKIWMKNCVKINESSLGYLK